jgi:hypothetical protein
LDTHSTTPKQEQDKQEKQDKQVTVDVPEDRLAEFYAFYSRFLAVGSTGWGRRGRHGHGRGGHHRAAAHGHGDGCGGRGAQTSEHGATAPAGTPVARPDTGSAD